jgi:hypothetical protein
MPKIAVSIPEDMAPYADELQYFVETMVRKLHCNRHKGYTKDMNPIQMMELATQEIEEANRAKGQFEFFVECADTANMAFLAAMCAIEMTRSEFDAM